MTNYKRKINNTDVLQLINEGKCFAQIGRAYGVSRERVRQIANKNNITGKKIVEAKNLQFIEELKLQPDNTIPHVKTETNYSLGWKRVLAQKNNLSRRRWSLVGAQFRSQDFLALQVGQSLVITHTQKNPRISAHNCAKYVNVKIKTRQLSKTTIEVTRIS